ncbi:MAG TPA: outer membrane beta-barrel protein [Burkholderiales bacterium]|nr:outer membrane beta-barrel protein [Burkholderiales bacterium]
MKRTLIALLALAASAAALTVQAQAIYPPKPTPALVGPYAGGLFGRSEAKSGCIGVISGGGRQCDPIDLAFGAFAGYQLHRYYGAEVGYTYLGRVWANSTGPGSATSQNVQASAWDLVALGILPFDENLSAFARVGGYRATLSTSERGEPDHTNFGFTYGGGLQFDFNRRYAVRALWQRYKKVGDDVRYGVNYYDVLGLSALYRFQ